MGTGPGGGPIGVSPSIRVVPPLKGFVILDVGLIRQRVYPAADGRCSGSRRCPACSTTTVFGVREEAARTTSGSRDRRSGAGRGHRLLVNQHQPGYFADHQPLHC